MCRTTGIRAAKKLLDGLPNPARRASVLEVAKGIKDSQGSGTGSANGLTWYEAVVAAIYA